MNKLNWFERLYLEIGDDPTPFVGFVMIVLLLVGLPVGIILIGGDNMWEQLISVGLAYLIVLIGGISYYLLYLYREYLKNKRWMIKKRKRLWGS